MSDVSQQTIAVVGISAAETLPIFTIRSTSGAVGTTSDTTSDDPVVQVELIQPATLPIDDNTSAEVPNDDVVASFQFLDPTGPGGLSR